jgi:hypothetical protein
MEDDELIIWKREAVQDCTVAGHWSQEKEIGSFKLSTYWYDTDTIGVLTDRDTGGSLMVFKAFRTASWRIA